jgi:hypothetical protein
MSHNAYVYYIETIQMCSVRMCSVMCSVKKRRRESGRRLLIATSATVAASPILAHTTSTHSFNPVALHCPTSHRPLHPDGVELPELHTTDLALSAETTAATQRSKTCVLIDGE